MREAGPSSARTILLLAPDASEGSEAAVAAAAVRDALRADLPADRLRIEAPWPIPEQVEDLVREADLAVYHLGNDVGLHGTIYGVAVEHPGLVVLHEVSLDRLGEGLIAEGDPLGIRARREARLRMRAMEASMPGLPPSLRLPWAAHAVQRARGVVVFSEFACRYLEAMGCRTPIRVAGVPPLVPGRPEERSEERLVGVFGDLGPERGLEAVLGALARLEGPRLVIAGRPHGGYPVEEVVAASGMTGRVRMLAGAGPAEVLSWIPACDAVIDLRHPDRAGSLPFLWTAVRAGVPAVVGAETVPELPEDAVVRLGPGPPEPEALAGALGVLLRNPELAVEMAGRAAAVARGRDAEAGVSHGRAVEETLALVEDPRRAPLSRWASALLDVGMDEASASRGFGLRYVEAVEEFSAGGPGG